MKKFPKCEELGAKIEEYFNLHTEKPYWTAFFDDAEKLEQALTQAENKYLHAFEKSQERIAQLENDVNNWIKAYKTAKDAGEKFYDELSVLHGTCGKLEKELKTAREALAKREGRCY
jgi:DNA anti-recombination protein RmuC